MARNAPSLLWIDFLHPSFTGLQSTAPTEGDRCRILWPFHPNNLVSVRSLLRSLAGQLLNGAKR